MKFLIKISIAVVSLLASISASAGNGSVSGYIDGITIKESGDLFIILTQTVISVLSKDYLLVFKEG